MKFVSLDSVLMTDVAQSKLIHSHDVYVVGK
jgi:hypothetical protein